MQVAVKTVSPQAAQAYKVLSQGKSMTVQELAQELKVLPNAIYRLTDKLVELGMIEKLSGYPFRYKANPPQSAMNWYLQAAAHSFRQEFVPPKAAAHKNPAINLSVIRNRDSSIRKTAADAAQANESINLIVSGLQIPDEDFQSFKKASARGVKIRVIVQQKRETTKRPLEKWQAAGAEVRYLPHIGIRMFIFDNRIVQINSYTPDNRENALGVRFIYPPLAQQMNILFEQNWQLAKPL